MTPRRTVRGLTALAAVLLATTAAVGALAPTEALAQTAAAPGAAGTAAATREPPKEIIRVPDWRGRAREVVETLSEYARARAPGFVLLMRGAPDLLFRTVSDDSLSQLLAPPGSLLDRTPDAPPVGTLERQFARTLDGVVLDNQYCGEAPPLQAAQVEVLHDFGLSVLAIERCADAVTAQQARAAASLAGVVAHVTTGQSLGAIPGGRLPGATAEMVQAIGEAGNVLVALDTGRYGSKADWLAALQETNHDVLIIPAFFQGDEALTPDDVFSLKLKKMGSPRLVIAALPVAVAQDTAWYWKKTWKAGDPAFILGPAGTPGTWRVDYGNAEWRTLVGQTFTGLMDLGFDGIMLDGFEVVKALVAEGPAEN